MNPTPDPHWTAYVTAVATPIVAIVAAVIAAYFGYVNARTARNKLKLDLFERRMKVVTTIRYVLNLTFEHEERLDDSTYADIENAINDSEYVFDEKVHKHLKGVTLYLYDEYLSVRRNMRNVRFRMSNGSVSGEEGETMMQDLYIKLDEATKRLFADERAVNDLLRPFLRLSH